MDRIYKHRVLIVYEYQEVSEVFQYYLTKHGYETFTTSSPKKALEILSKHPMDIVITYDLMSHISGHDLTKIIKKNYDLDVILVTGGLTTDEEAISIGANDLLNIPFTESDLLDSINKILGTGRILNSNKDLIKGTA